MKKTGLVLEGGATRGVFTSGALDYLMEQDFYLPYVVGVSAGACNAVDYVSRQIGRTRACMICEDKGNSYISVRQMVRNKSLFDMDMIFDRYPNEIFPFDFKTYFTSDTKCEIVVTNCQTGKAEYLSEESDKDRLMKICRASSSIPIASPMVEVGGQLYLDGGIADSIPIRHALYAGYKKNVVILTRNEGYRKLPDKKYNALAIATFKKYPELVKAIYYRSVIYNKTMELVERLEREGRIFVLRPQIPEVNRAERDPQKLTAFYQHGYDYMKERYDDLLDYVNAGR